MIEELPAVPAAPAGPAASVVRGASVRGSTSVRGAESLRVASLRGASPADGAAFVSAGLEAPARSGWLLSDLGFRRLPIAIPRSLLRRHRRSFPKPLPARLVRP